MAAAEIEELVGDEKAYGELGIVLLPQAIW